MFTEKVTTDVGTLEGPQVVRYRETLNLHGIDDMEVAMGKRPALVYVCLWCQSIGEIDTSDPELARRSRDHMVENYDMGCCGVTVVFHSSHAVLVDPANLVLVAGE